MPDPSDYPKLAQDAFNRRDLEALGALWAPDFRYDAPGGESTATREASLARERVLFRAFPDLRSDLGRNAALGDTLVIEGVLEGTHRGAIRLGGRDIPPTGRAVRIEFVGVFRFGTGSRDPSASTTTGSRCWSSSARSTHARSPRSGSPPGGWPGDPPRYCRCSRGALRRRRWPWSGPRRPRAR